MIDIFLVIIKADKCMQLNFQNMRINFGKYAGQMCNFMQKYAINR